MTPPPLKVKKCIFIFLSSLVKIIIIYMYSISHVSFLSLCRTNVLVSGVLLIGPTSITAFVYWVCFITVWRISVSIGFNTPASLIAFIETSLTRQFDIKIKAHVL